MADRSLISWTDATWSPVSGCTRISEGCANCYIERTPPFRMAKRRFDGPHIGATTGVTLHPERLAQPLRWRQPRRIFVCSMADLFHADVPDGLIAAVWLVMGQCAGCIPEQYRGHTFQILTKRPARMREPLLGPVRLDPLWLAPASRFCALPGDDPLTAEGFAALQALGRAAARRFTAESGEHVPGFLSWVVTGGESGPDARPCHPDWVRALRDQCARYGVAFHHKQWGEWLPLGPLYGDDDNGDDRSWDAAEDAKFEAAHLEAVEGRRVAQLESSGHIADGYQPGDDRTWLMARVGKKLAGRVLDGVVHDRYPGDPWPAGSSVGAGHG